jgi:hypothetical protein
MVQMNTDKNDNSDKNPTLEGAWNCFADYDDNAVLAQTRFLYLRKSILIFGLLATASAVFYSVMPDDYVVRDINLKSWFRYLVIILPILVSVLLAGAVKFERGTNWVLLRGSAEALKSEIYKYRASIGIYKKEKSEEERDIKLARKVKTIGERLMKTQVNQASLKPKKGNHGFNQSAAKGDKRFADLDADSYIKWRLLDQYNFYRKKSGELDKRNQVLHWLIYALGGLGTFLAAIGFEIWVAVTSGSAGALAAFMEIKRIEPTITAYNQAATDLNGIRVWWTALPEEDKEKKENFEKLVNNAEAVIQTENAGWVQEMQDSLAELYAEANPEMQSG